MKKKAIIISGGSSGIGKAIVEKFLLNDYYVFNLDIIKIPSINAVNNNKHLYNWVKTDISNENAIYDAIEHIKTHTSSLNVEITTVIANAGKHLAANIEETTTEQLYELLNINLLGCYWLIKYTISLLKQNGGTIITIGSDQSTIAKPNSAVYGITKAAIAHLTKSTALDYAKFNIRVNCIAAGTIDTPLYQNAITSYCKKTNLHLEQIKEQEAKAQPLGRIGNPSEIAAAVYFLTQDCASYITGAVIPIDGGYTIQ